MNDLAGSSMKGLQGVIRTDWSDKLRFATQAPLAELIIPDIRVTGALEGDDLGLITSEDIEILATAGLPRSEGWLYPAIESKSSTWDATATVFKLGSYDSGINSATGRPRPEGPHHLFVASPDSGEVLKVSHQHGGYRVRVNTSIRLFVDMAWRYHHAQTVLHDMQYLENEDGSPSAGPEEEQAIKDLLWQWAFDTDPIGDDDPTLSFWWGNIKTYM